jgi:hypothetical protein
MRTLSTLAAGIVLLAVVPLSHAQQQPDPVGARGGVTGSGTANTIPVWTGTSSIGNSVMFQSNGNLGVGTTTPGSKLDVAGDIDLNGILRFQGSAFLRAVQGGNLSFSDNLALGLGALQNNNAGTYNTAIGTGALQNETTGFANTGVGFDSLFQNTSGGNNTAVGQAALEFNTTGTDNTAIGAGALTGNFNNVGSLNTGIGSRALDGNSMGDENTATGALALESNNTGGSNTGIGTYALELNTSGSNNTAIGRQALFNNQVGGNNIAIGFKAAINVLSTNSNNIHIGSVGSTNDNAVIRIGGNPILGDPGIQTTFFAAGIRGITTGQSNAVPVVIDSNGQLGTINSSRRFKEDIQDMADASNGLMRLRPVTFRYQKPFADGSKPIQYGLIAEEVAGVYPDLVAKGADGQIEAVKYQVLDSMLLNEVQRQEKEIHGLRAENDLLRDRLGRLEAALIEMTGSVSRH